MHGLRCNPIVCCTGHVALSVWCVSMCRNIGRGASRLDGTLIGGCSPNYEHSVLTISSDLDLPC